MLNKFNVGDTVYVMPPANDDRPIGWTSAKERAIGEDYTVKSWVRNSHGYIYSLNGTWEQYAEEELKPARQW